MNPYLVLNVPAGADDAAIRRAYLEAIKLAPPDGHPKRFQALSQAYERIKDEPSRINYALFNKDPFASSPVDLLVRYVQARSHVPPLPFEAMKAYLRSCSKAKPKS